MLENQSNSRQIPKTQDICANKDYYDILYGYLQEVSIKKEDGRYFTKKDINFSKLGEMFGISRQTISTKFKNLGKLGLYEEIDGEYKLVELDKDIAALVPYRTLKLITDTLNERSISIYVYLLNRYYANGCESFVFTLDQLKAHVGLSTSTRSNNEIITNILYVLGKIGLLKFSMTALQQDGDAFQNVKTIYKIDWLTNDLISEF